MRKPLRWGRNRLAALVRTEARVRLLLAWLVALSAMLAALAVWRAETAAIKGDEAVRAGFADSVGSKREQAGARTDVEAFLLQYLDARAAAAQARALRAEARAAPRADAPALGIQADAVTDLKDDYEARGFDSSVPKKVAAALRTEFGRDYGLRRYRFDLDPEPEYAAGETYHRKSEDIVGVAALLVAAAFVFTLGQVFRSRSLFFVRGGLLVLISAVVWFVVVEGPL